MRRRVLLSLEMEGNFLKVRSFKGEKYFTDLGRSLDEVRKILDLLGERL